MWAVLLAGDWRAGHFGYGLAEVARLCAGGGDWVAVCFGTFAVVGGVAAVHVDEVFALGGGRVAGCGLVLAAVAPEEECED